MIAILFVLAGLFHSYVEAQLNQAAAIKEQLQIDLDMRSTAASVHYMIGTRRRTLAGQTVDLADQNLPFDQSVSRLEPVGGEIRLDGRFYQGVGKALFSIQDQGGLLAVNAESTQGLLENVLEREVGASRADELAARLADYIDENVVRRFNGAEAAQYQSEGLSPPTNWYIRSEPELYNVLGWDGILDEGKVEPWRDLFSVAYANALNINAAPEALLRMRLGLSSQDAQQLIAARERHAFRSLDGVADALGVINTWQEEEFSFFPSEGLTIKISCEACAYTLVQRLTITQDGFYGPWQMDYSYVADGNRADRETDAAAAVDGSLF